MLRIIRQNLKMIFTEDYSRLEKHIDFRKLFIKYISSEKNGHVTFSERLDEASLKTLRKLYNHTTKVCYIIKRAKELGDIPQEY